MHLLLITGFLGSGKTTLATRLAKAATARWQRVAILLNEIGEIGIDNQLMRQLDLNVWELLGGCICCTLSGDLVTTLQQLDADYHPNLVLVEPSGAADPSGVLKALPYYRGAPLESVRTLSILDALRLQLLYEVMTPLITAHIQQADLILVSKCDLASPDEIVFARQIAQEINPQALLFDSDSQELTPELAYAMLPWLS
ncbi:MAG: cobalamin biosynthesis protein P47K [Chloroflexi bacterium]|nr:cobalamin biosynthesis protein P47K [Chloroflexota bacterium]